ncbi:hypothetical protein [Salinibacterium sp. PAMC 21357]|uniref:hypothetical protein n=1 Tax=Salinibacterium sp. PAMC 21357 TaxID=1112215 RepID=UPI00028A3C17|nr:hypothetical protein [Salinibacterium sp. PAMC 21357]
MSDDPTRLRNQPSLTTASGNSWLIIGALFAAISIGMLAALATLPPSGLALVAIAVIIALYLVMLILRFTVHARRRRLRLIAVCLLSIAAVGLGSVVAIAAINWAAL